MRTGLLLVVVVGCIFLLKLSRSGDGPSFLRPVEPVSRTEIENPAAYEMDPAPPATIDRDTTSANDESDESQAKPRKLGARYDQPQGVLSGKQRGVVKRSEKPTGAYHQQSNRRHNERPGSPTR